jgi:hypothetical protein
MVAEMTMKTSSPTACGTYRVRVYVVTTAAPATAPRTITSLPLTACMTRFHSMNHQLRLTKPRTEPRGGRATPHHRTWLRTMRR